MITLGIVAIMAIMSVVVLSAARKPLRHHRPRALDLVLALPPAPPTLLGQVMHGRATIGGECAWCRGPWETCALGCVRRAPRPAPTPTPGPGERRRG